MLLNHMLRKVRQMEFKIINPKKEKLNNFVSKNKYATIFQTGSIIDAYHSVPNCEAISLAAVDENDEIIASLVGVRFIEKSGIFSALSSHSTIRGGPIWVDSEIGKNAAIGLIKEYDRITKKSTVYNKMVPSFNNNSSEILQLCGYKFEDDLNFLINLNRPSKEIWGLISKSKRKCINRAEKKGVTIKEVENEDELRSFYKLHIKTSLDAKISTKDFKLFHNVYEGFVQSGLAKIFLAVYDNTYIGGRLILTYQNTIYDWYAGSNSNFHHLYPNDYLVWHVLSWGSDNGYCIFDFGGAGSPHKEYGVREFKRRFGGELVNYGEWVKINSPIKLRVAKIGFKVYKMLGEKNGQKIHL